MCVCVRVCAAAALYFCPLHCRTLGEIYLLSRPHVNWSCKYGCNLRAFQRNLFQGDICYMRLSPVPLSQTHQHARTHPPARTHAPTQTHTSPSESSPNAIFRARLYTQCLLTLARAPLLSPTSGVRVCVCACVRI